MEVAADEPRTLTECIQVECPNSPMNYLLGEVQRTTPSVVVLNGRVKTQVNSVLGYVSRSFPEENAADSVPLPIQLPMHNSSIENVLLSPSKTSTDVEYM